MDSCDDSCDCNVLTESVRFNWRNEVRSCAETGPEAVLGDRKLTLPVGGEDSRSVSTRPYEHVQNRQTVQYFQSGWYESSCERVKRDFRFW